jgi:transposase-like protein
MHQDACQDFFSQPAGSTQRRYEVLRAVFFEGLPMTEVAGRFDVAHGTVRNWASVFRRQVEQGAPPPFSNRCHADDPFVTRRPRRSHPRSPMCGSCRSRQDAACERPWPACFSFYRC